MPPARAAPIGSTFNDFHVRYPGTLSANGQGRIDAIARPLGALAEGTIWYGAVDLSGNFSGWLEAGAVALPPLPPPDAGGDAQPMSEPGAPVAPLQGPVPWQRQALIPLSSWWSSWRRPFAGGEDPLDSFRRSDETRTLMSPKLARTPDPPYYAVIFANQRTEGDNGYAQTADRMMALARDQPGFLGVDSVRGDSGIGITVSYWESEEAIANWRRNSEHQAARESGRELWYQDFVLRVAKVERAYEK